jgi:hypothetical protein
MEEELEFHTRKQYEECAKNEQQPSTSSAIKEEDEASEDIIIEHPYEPSSSPPPHEEMLIDVKAEQVIDCDKPDDGSTSVVNLSILS